MPSERRTGSSRVGMILDGDIRLDSELLQTHLSATIQVHFLTASRKLTATYPLG